MKTKSQTKTPSTDDGRDSTTGKFIPGNPGGPGNPYARASAEMRKAFMEAVTIEDMKAIARTLCERAKKGEIPAIAILLDRALGKVNPAPDPDTLDIEEMELAQKKREMEDAEKVHELLSSP